MQYWLLIVLEKNPASLKTSCNDAYYHPARQPSPNIKKYECHSKKTEQL